MGSTPVAYHFHTCLLLLTHLSPSSSSLRRRNTNTLLLIASPLRMILLLVKVLVALNVKRAVHNMRSPRRRAKVPGALGIGEHGFNFLEGFAGCLREHQEDVDEHCDAEDAEEDVDLFAVSM